MKNMKKRRKKIYALILLLVITIGYALISTTLKINGVAGIKSNQWDIHWENVQPNQQSTVTTQTPQITENRTKVSYEVNLELPGDFYEFTVDAKNDGTINAKILDIRHSVYLSTDLEHTTTLPSYIKYSIVYDGTEDAPAIGDILASGDKQTYRIRIEYDPLATTLPGSDTTYKIIDEIDYGQTKDEPEQTGFVATPKECTENSCLPTTGCGNIGDEFCIGEECFNLISCNNDKAVLFAKYNLLVGTDCTGIQNNYDSDVVQVCPNIPNTTEGYGKQYAESVMHEGDSFNTYAILPFSPVDYWYGNVGPEGSGKKYVGTIRSSGYNDHFTDIDYYSPPAYVYDENSNLYQPIEDYATYLKSIGAPNTIKARVISSQETWNFGCGGGGYCDEKWPFMYSTEYWTGSASAGTHYHDYTIYSYIDVITTYTNCNSAADYREAFGYGVRPVVEIPLSSIAYDKWRFLNPGSTGTDQQFQYWKNGKTIKEGLVPNLPDFSNNLRTYYFKDSLVQYGWHKIEDSVYYFSEIDTDGNGYTDGNMVFGGDKTINGITYTFADDGKCTSNNCPTL